MTPDATGAVPAAPTLDRWRRTWRELGVATPDDALYHQVMARYAEPHRTYHNASHLGDCLAGLDPVRAQAAHPAEVELALWFHDAVYEARSHDNEDRSAAWARTACRTAGVPAGVADRVGALVLVTRHDATPVGADAGIIADVDLAILGAPPERFDAYERQIRQEYAWVPAQFYRRERRKILQGFLDRPTIFHTAHFFRERERAARDNLRRAIQRLGGPPRPDRTDHRD